MAIVTGNPIGLLLTLTYTVSGNVLVIQDSSHDHVADGASLSTGVELVIQDSAHAHYTDGLNSDSELLKSLVNTVVFQWFVIHIIPKRYHRIR